jgi:hypothetical protein
MNKFQTPRRGGGDMFLHNLITFAGVPSYRSSRSSCEILKYGLTEKSFYSYIPVTYAKEHFNEL